MRSNRFGVAFALIAGAGLAASAFANPPRAYEPPAETEQTAKPVTAPAAESEAPEIEVESVATEWTPSRPFNNPVARFDRDGNGRLNPKERKAARAGLRMSRMSLMTEIDTDGDLRISDEEWSSFSASFGERDEDHFFRRREVFREFDANRNGGLDPKELKKAMRELQDRRLDFVMQFDENTDGALSDEELEVAANFVERRRDWFLARWDSNADGSMDEYERRAAMTAWASAAND